MNGLSEAELHVQAMRLVCEALADREQQGIEVDWDVLRQMHDHMDAMLQALQHKHRYDSSEMVDLRRDRDAARAEIETLRKELTEAQQERVDAIDDYEGQIAAAEALIDPEANGETTIAAMADMILHLREQLAEQQAETVDVRRQRNNETDRLNATNAVSVQQRDEIAYLRARLDEERSVSAGLREQLDAANAAVTLQRTRIERRRRVVDKVRQMLFKPNRDIEYGDINGLRAAIAELDADTEPTPVAEPATCPECERLRQQLGAALASLTRERLDAGTEPTPVAEPLDEENDTCQGK